MSTTARLLYDRALGHECDRRTVEWAVALLLQGRDGELLRRLAAMQPPLNHFELARLRDLALEEQGIEAPTPEKAILAYAAEAARRLLAGQAEAIATAAELCGLCIEADYDRRLMPFFNLHYAAIDLEDGDVQWYFDGATRDNVRDLIVEQARLFVSRSIEGND